MRTSTDIPQHIAQEMYNLLRSKTRLVLGVNFLYETRLKYVNVSSITLNLHTLGLQERPKHVDAQVY